MSLLLMMTKNIVAMKPNPMKTNGKNCQEVIDEKVGKENDEKIRMFEDIDKRTKL